MARPKRSHLINEEIRVPSVRLIDEDGEQVGVVSTNDAMDRARMKNLDLVLISPNPSNPVARLMDYGKYAFEQSKREREAKRNQKTLTVKEVQLKLTTEEHDTAVKVRNAVRFLSNGDRVKVVIRFRGREMAYQNQGYEVMEHFAREVGEICQIDRQPRVEGRHMVMFLSPSKEQLKSQSANE